MMGGFEFLTLFIVAVSCETYKTNYEYDIIPETTPSDLTRRGDTTQFTNDKYYGRMSSPTYNIPYRTRLIIHYANNPLPHGAYGSLSNENTKSVVIGYINRLLKSQNRLKGLEEGKELYWLLGNSGPYGIQGGNGLHGSQGPYDLNESGVDYDYHRTEGANDLYGSKVAYDLNKLQGAYGLYGSIGDSGNQEAQGRYALQGSQGPFGKHVTDVNHSQQSFQGGSSHYESQESYALQGSQAGSGYHESRGSRYDLQQKPVNYVSPWSYSQQAFLGKLAPQGSQVDFGNDISQWNRLQGSPAGFGYHEPQGSYGFQGLQKDNSPQGPHWGNVPHVSQFGQRNHKNIATGDGSSWPQNGNQPYGLQFDHGSQGNYNAATGNNIEGSSSWSSGSYESRNFYRSTNDDLKVLAKFEAGHKVNETDRSEYARGVKQLRSQKKAHSKKVAHGKPRPVAQNVPIISNEEFGLWPGDGRICRKPWLYNCLPIAGIHG